MIEPLHAHWVATKHVLRYLHGTINLGLRCIVRDVRLHRYIDVDWAETLLIGRTHQGVSLVWVLP